MKNISILGSSGSIGRSTLDVIRKNPDRFRVIGLAVDNSITELIEQVKEFHPRIISVGNKEKADLLKGLIDPSITVTYGIDGLIEVACHNEVDIVMNSVVGATGIRPTIEALKNKKDIAIANKESLVVAGEYITRIAKENDCRLIPVDSEHSAIFQCLNGETKNSIHKLLLTASGGAFRDLSREQMLLKTPEDALKHPNWNMGNKLTIDCATLMNKGFEVMEAHWLFDIPYEQIDVFIHKESIVHSMVEFVDGSIIAQLGVPDMRIPIQYAFSYPNRLNSSFEKINLSKLTSLHFESPDFVRFPCLKYAYEAGKTGGTLPAVLNAANEVANKAFLQKKIRFLDIEAVIYHNLGNHENVFSPSIDEIFEADTCARKTSAELIEKMYTSIQ